MDKGNADRWDSPDEAILAAPTASAPRGLSRRALARACAFIQDQLGTRVELQDIAGAACISRSHFARLFRQSTGRSPMEYLLHARVARAKELLSQGDVPMCEIAIALGFCDQSHFCRHFKRLVGMTPREFARQQADLHPLDSRATDHFLPGWPAAHAA